MSSQNNDSSAAMAIGLVVAVITMIGMVIFAVAAFLTFVLTILSLCAWNKPLRLSKAMTIQPEEARGFVKRGIAGAFLLPAFAVFCVIVFEVHINDDAWNYIIAAGYIAGSLGIEMLMAEEHEKQAKAAALLPPEPPAPPQHKALPSHYEADRPPFRFASWDDEEEFDGRS